MSQLALVLVTACLALAATLPAGALPADTNTTECGGLLNTCLDCMTTLSCSKVGAVYRPVSSASCPAAKPYCQDGVCAPQLSDESCLRPPLPADTAFDCGTSGDGYFPDPSNCRRYYLCVGGVAYRYDCSNYGGTVYGHTRAMCVPSSEASCDTTTCNAKQVGAYQLYKQDPAVYVVCTDTNAANALIGVCPRNNTMQSSTETCAVTCTGNGRIPYPDSEKKYYECIKVGANKFSGPMPRTCPGSWVFDSRTQRCATATSDTASSTTPALPKSTTLPTPSSEGDRGSTGTTTSSGATTAASTGGTSDSGRQPATTNDTSGASTGGTADSGTQPATTTDTSGGATTAASTEVTAASGTQPSTTTDTSGGATTAASTGGTADSGTQPATTTDTSVATTGASTGGTADSGTQPATTTDTSGGATTGASTGGTADSGTQPATTTDTSGGATTGASTGGTADSGTQPVTTTDTSGGATTGASTGGTADSGTQPATSDTSGASTAGTADAGTQPATTTDTSGGATTAASTESATDSATQTGTTIEADGNTDSTRSTGTDVTKVDVSTSSSDVTDSSALPSSSQDVTVTTQVPDLTTSTDDSGTGSRSPEFATDESVTDTDSTTDTSEGSGTGNTTAQTDSSTSQNPSVSTSSSDATTTTVQSESTTTSSVPSSISEDYYAPDATVDEELYRMPPSFLLGVGSSSYQTEGAWDEDGRSPSIQDDFYHSIGLANGDSACDSYHDYLQDVALIRNLTFQTYRLSLSWSRLLPTGSSSEPNQKAVEYYTNLLDALNAQNIEPAVTLHHWDTPSIFVNGWLNASMPGYFLDYASYAFSVFGSRVKTWIILNDPVTFCVSGYERGTTAPGVAKSGGTAAYQCVHNQILAHARAYRAYQAYYAEEHGGQVGSSLLLDYGQPLNEASASDRAAAQRYMATSFAWVADPLLTGEYPTELRAIAGNRLPNFTSAEISLVKVPSSKEPVGHTLDSETLDASVGLNNTTAFVIPSANSLEGALDFIGLKHTSARLCTNGAKGFSNASYTNDVNVVTSLKYSWNRTSSGREAVTPWGIRDALNWIKTRYSSVTPQVGVLITENGYAGAKDEGITDSARSGFFSGYLRGVMRALNEDGCNVLGYIAWSLTDNFAWNDAYTVKYGLAYVDFDSPTLNRTLKDSSSFFTRILTTRVVDYVALS